MPIELWGLFALILLFCIIEYRSRREDAHETGRQ
jgi:hypothetical protein